MPNSNRMKRRQKAERLHVGLKSKPAKTSVTGKKHVLGTTKEGIQIVKPRGNPSSFTWQELRDAVAGVFETSAT